MKTREQVMKWWNSFEASTRQSLCSDYHTHRQFNTLTGSEIENIWRKETKTEENNIYLNRLKEQYKKYKSATNKSLSYSFGVTYRIERAFCLDTQLVSFNDIEAMEYEINSVF